MILYFTGASTVTKITAHFKMKSLNYYLPHVTRLKNRINL